MLQALGRGRRLTLPISCAWAPAGPWLAAFSPVARSSGNCYICWMSIPPRYFLHELGPQAQEMSRNCSDARMAMILQYVAIGSLIAMTGIAAGQMLRETFGPSGRDRSQLNGQLR